MFSSRVTRRIALASSVLAAAVLGACSSSDSGSITDLDVTPALGIVYGAPVSVYNASGALLGTGTTAAKTSSSAGKARVSLSGYAPGTPVIIKVSIVPGVIYFNEGTNAEVTAPAGTSTSLLSFAPSVTSGGSVGVSSLSNMAAKLAGIDASALTGSALTTPLTATAIYTAVAKTNLFVGLPANTNLLAAPVPATLANPLPTDTYGRLLAKIVPATGDALAQATSLAATVLTTGVAASNVSAINTINTALTSNASSIGLTIAAPNTAPTATQLSTAVTAVTSTIAAGTKPTGSTGSTGSTGGTNGSL